MKKQNIFIVLIVIFILILAAIMFIISPRIAANKVTQLSVLNSFGPEVSDIFTSQLKHFDNINSDIELIVTTSKKATLEDFEIVIWYGLLPEESIHKYSKPILLSGDFWELAVNKNILSHDQRIKLLEAVTLSELSETFKSIKSTGITPIAVGNSHKWPLVLWEQHLIASYNPDFPFTEISGNIYQTEEAREALSVLKEWYNSDFFYTDVWNDGWAQGISAVIEGKAAVVLMSGRMKSSIPTELTSIVEYIPFLGGLEQTNWVIGSGYSLSYKLEGEYSEEAQKLITYLTSPAIAEKLSQETRQNFYSQEDQRAAQFIPSWEVLANTSEMREFGEIINNEITE